MKYREFTQQEVWDNRSKLECCAEQFHQFVGGGREGGETMPGSICIHCGGSVSRSAATWYGIGILHGIRARDDIAAAAIASAMAARPEEGTP